MLSPKNYHLMRKIVLQNLGIPGIIQTFCTKMLGSDHHGHREAVLFFLKHFPNGHPRGMLYKFITDLGIKPILIGRNFVKCKFKILPFVYKSYIVKLPPNGISFHDDEWLQPQVRGLEPPNRPNYLINKLRWDMAIYSCKQYSAKMKSTTLQRRSKTS